MNKSLKEFLGSLRSRFGMEEIYDSDDKKERKRKINYNASLYNKCLTQAKEDMVKYNILMKRDDFGLQAESTPVQPSIESSVVFMDPHSVGKKDPKFVFVFSKPHVEELQSYGWVEVPITIIRGHENIYDKIINFAEESTQKSSANNNDIFATDVDEAAAMDMVMQLNPSSSPSGYMDTTDYWKKWNSKDHTVGDFLDWMENGVVGEYPAVLQWDFQAAKMGTVYKQYRKLLGYYSTLKECVDKGTVDAHIKFSVQWISSLKSTLKLDPSRNDLI